MTHLANGAWGRRTKADAARNLPDGAKIALTKYRNRFLIEYPNGDRAWRLHLSDVVLVKPDGTVILNDHGFATITTREAFGEGLAKLTNIGRRVGSGGKIANHALGYGDGAIYFEHRLVLDGDGNVLDTDATPNELKQRKQLKKRIGQFVQLVHDLPKLPEPSQGDCFGCQFAGDGDDNPLGTSHLLDHFKEGYLTGSLIIKALRATGYRDAGISLFWHGANAEAPGSHIKWGNRARIAHALQKYLNRKLGLST